MEAAFRRESYSPGSTASLIVYNRGRGLRLQIFHAGPEGTRTVDNVTMNGVAMTKPIALGKSSGRRSINVRIGAWPTGLYFARMEAADGRVGYAPFIVRPNRLGEHRIAVVHADTHVAGLQPARRDGDGRATPGTRAGSHEEPRALGRPFLEPRRPTASASTTCPSCTG